MSNQTKETLTSNTISVNGINTIGRDYYYYGGVLNSGVTTRFEDSDLRKFFKSLLLILGNDKNLELLAICPEAITLIDNPTEDMLEIAKFEAL